MATTLDELTIKVNLETGEATVGLKDLAKAMGGLDKAAEGADEGVESLSDQFKNAAIAGIGLNQILELGEKAMGAFADTVGEAVEAFEEAEAIQTRLNASLAVNGKFTAEATKQWDEYADMIERVSTIDDDNVKSLAAKSIAMGRTDAQTRQLIETANDLAVVFDGDVNEAFNSLSGTLNGVVPRGLNQVDGRLKNLTETELRNGKAVQMLSERYKGFAEVLVNTTEGAKAQAANALGNVFEEVGNRIDDIFDFKTLYQNSRDFLRGLKEDLKALEPVAKEIGAAFRAIAEAIRLIDFEELAANAQVLAGALAILAAVNLAPLVVAVGAAAAEFLLMATAVAATVAALDLVIKNTDKLPQVADLFVAAFLAAFSKIDEALMGLVRSILQQMTGLAIAIGEAFPGTKLAGMAADAALALGKSVGFMTEQLEEQAKFTESMIKDLEEAAKGLDLGLVGALKRQIENLVKNFKDAYKRIKGEVDDGDKGPKNRAPQDMAPKAKLPELFTAQDAQLIGQMFGTGAGSFATAASTMAAVPLGMLQAANIILDAILKIINIIPEILKKIGDIFYSIANFPQKIVEALEHIMNGAVNLTRNIWKNISKFGQQLMDSLVSFAEELPDAIMESMKEFPDLMIRLMERLPDIVERMASELGEAFPEIAFTFVKSIIGNLPRIYIAFVKMWAQLVVGIVRGILQGLQKGFKNIFGKGPKIEIDTEGLKDIGKKITDATTGVTDNVFRVIDINAQGRAKSLGEEIRAALETGIARVKDIWQQMIDALLRAWRWIYENIILPIAQMFQALWGFLKDLWEQVIMPIVQFLVDGLRSVWEFVVGIVNKLVDGLAVVWSTVIQPLVDKMVDGFRAVWDFAKTLIDKMVDGFRVVWDYAKTLIDKLVDGFKDVWEKTVKPIVDKLGEAGKAIYDKLKENLDKAGDAMKSVGTKIWDGLKSGIDGAAATFTGIGTSIWNSLKTGIDGIGANVKAQLDKLNPSNLASKIFNWSGATGTGKVEGVLGIDVPFVNFATGGLVGGRARVAGDSKLNDRILAAVSPGEAIIPRSLMQDPSIRAFVEQILEGQRTVPMFAYGVKDLKKDLGGGGGGGGGIGGLFDDIAETGKAGFEGLGNLGSEALGTLEEFLGGLNPDQLWNKVMDKVGEGVMSALSRNKFADGGIVGGSLPPIRSGAPMFPMAMAAAGAGSGGGTTSTTYDVKMNIYTQGQVDGNKLYQEFTARLMRDSLDGKPVVDERGVRKR